MTSSESPHPPDPFCLRFGNLHIVPVCHYRMEFAAHTRDVFLSLQPDAVAVELPSTLAGAITTAVKRFPHLSVVFYKGGRGEIWYYPIEPTDALMEGVRSALEFGIPVSFVDLDLDSYPLIFDPMPDSYVLCRLGLGAYWEAYDKAVREGYRNVRTNEDERREIHMAWHLQRLLEKGKKVLFICGAAHVHGVLRRLASPQVVPVGKMSREGVQVYNLHPDSIREVCAEMPFIIALYETIRGGHEPPSPGAAQPSTVLSFVDRRHAAISREESGDAEGRASLAQEDAPGRGSLEQEDPGCDFTFQVNGERRESSAPRTDAVDFDDDLSSRIMKILGAKLGGLPGKPETGGLLREEDPFADLLQNVFERARKPSKVKGDTAFKFRESTDRRDEILRFLNHLASERPRGHMPDRRTVLVRFLRQGAAYYQENTGDEIKQWQLLTFMKFARNYALVTGRLLPDFFQMMVAARGVGDDNFAYEIWDLGSYYPWEDRSGAFPTVRIDCEEVWIDGKKLYLRRRFPALRKRLVRIPGGRRKKEEHPGEWAEKFDGAHICSYPPEDVVVEEYGAYLKKRAMLMLSEERVRIEPFTTSILDGIDVRETIRNWHEKKLFVRELQKISGGAGSVVVIFDDDTDDSRYPWKMTWLGEHNQESDMAFYATSASRRIVGPGIARAEYGGFLMTYPPGRLVDVWGDPFYGGLARTKSEVLLMAGIEYSMEKHVVYVAKNPPRSWFRSLAGRLGKKLVYIPIGMLSPVTIKKIRVFHVLSGHKVREYAKEYIW